MIHSLTQRPLWLGITLALVLLPIGCGRGEDSGPPRDRQKPPVVNKDSSGDEKPPGEASKGTRVVFVGNSHVFMLDMPRLVTALAAVHAEKPLLSCRMIAVGGATLTQHASNPRTLKELEAGRYDWVVLQEASGLANGQVPRQDFLRAVERLGAVVRKANPKARLALYMVHAPEFALGSFPTIRDLYGEAGRKVGALVIPVAAAWDKVRRSAPEIRLTMPDGNHFNDKGCYLTSCTIFSALTERSCVGLPGKVGHWNIAEAEAARLQEAAWDAVTQGKKTSAKN